MMEAVQTQNRGCNIVQYMQRRRRLTLIRPEDYCKHKEDAPLHKDHACYLEIRLKGNCKNKLELENLSLQEFLFGPSYVQYGVETLEKVYIDVDADSFSLVSIFYFNTWIYTNT